MIEMNHSLVLHLACSQDRCSVAQLVKVASAAHSLRLHQGCDPRGCEVAALLLEADAQRDEITELKSKFPGGAVASSLVAPRPKMDEGAAGDVSDTPATGESPADSGAMHGEAVLQTASDSCESTKESRATSSGDAFAGEKEGAPEPESAPAISEGPAAQSPTLRDDVAPVVPEDGAQHEPAKGKEDLHDEDALGRRGEPLAHPEHLTRDPLTSAPASNPSTRPSVLTEAGNKEIEGQSGASQSGSDQPATTPGVEMSSSTEKAAHHEEQVAPSAGLAPETAEGSANGSEFGEPVSVRVPAPVSPARASDTTAGPDGRGECAKCARPTKRRLSSSLESHMPEREAFLPYAGKFICVDCQAELARKKCKGKTGSTGEPCTKKPKPNGYCGFHQKQMPVETEVAHG